MSTMLNIPAPRHLVIAAMNAECAAAPVARYALERLTLAQIGRAIERHKEERRKIKLAQYKARKLEWSMPGERI